MCPISQFYPKSIIPLSARDGRIWSEWTGWSSCRFNKASQLCYRMNERFCFSEDTSKCTDEYGKKADEFRVQVYKEICNNNPQCTSRWHLLSILSFWLQWMWHCQGDLFQVVTRPLDNDDQFLAACFSKTWIHLKHLPDIIIFIQSFRITFTVVVGGK